MRQPRAKRAKAKLRSTATVRRPTRHRAGWPDTSVGRGGRERLCSEPERRCIVTRDSGSKSGLIRFVVGPDNEIVPDLAERLPGRGIWVSAEAGVLQQAATKGHFNRAARQQVQVPPDLVARVERLLAQRLVDLVALARRAGEALAG